MLKLNPCEESAVVISAPLVNTFGYTKKLKKKYPNIAVIDCNLFPELTLAAFKKIADKKIKAIQQSNHSTLCICAADVLFPLGPPPFLYLQSLKIQNPKISLIFLISQTPLTERLRARFLSVPMLFENIYYTPLDKKSLPFKNKEQAKNFFLLLNGNQRRILRMLVRGEENIPSALKPDKEYLEKLNIVNKRYGRWRLVSPLLEKAALEVTEGLREPLTSKNKTLLIGTQDITSQFSPQQKKVMLKLLKAKGKIVTRSEIARNLWGRNWPERYSDWAIDQLICSLRHKLSRLWVSPKALVSKKKKGVFYSIFRQ